jgi:hypothetical protein
LVIAASTQVIDGYGQRFIVGANEKLTAFVELESGVRLKNSIDSACRHLHIGNARISAELVKKVNEITTRLGNDISKKD